MGLWARCAAVSLLVLGLASPLDPQSPRRGIVGRAAPSWEGTEWRQLPEGKQSLDVADLRGRVVYLYCFQSWCPGCHSRGFPTLEKLVERYDGDEDVSFVAIQTVFEGSETNNAEAAWQTAKRYSLEIPVGHSGGRGHRSPLMRAYRTGGTPWVVIIDRAGKVRFDGFHIDERDAARRIDALKMEPAPTAPDSPPPLPGSDRIGTPIGEPAFTRLLRGETKDGEWTLYRWWTDGCRFCRDSLPALDGLRERFAPRGLRTVAVYHRKSPGSIEDSEVLGMADRLGFRGPVAIDVGWKSLRRFWLETGERSATSASFLVDPRGTIRFVHPGPVFFPESRRVDAAANPGYRALETALGALLPPAPRKSDDGSPAPDDPGTPP